MQTVTITVPASRVVSIRGIDVEIDFSQAKDLAGFAQRMFDYGFRKFNDAAPQGLKAPTGDEAAMERFKAECAANAKAMITDWLAGDFSTERGGRAADPLTAKAREIARGLVVAKYGKPGKDEAAKAEFSERVAKAAAHEKVIALAKAELDKAAKLADII